MRCYLVEGPGVKRYAGSNADAKTTRIEIMDNLGCAKSAITITQVEIPTPKAELLEFVNWLCKSSDSVM